MRAHAHAHTHTHRLSEQWGNACRERERESRKVERMELALASMISGSIRAQLLRESATRFVTSTRAGFVVNVVCFAAAAVAVVVVVVVAVVTVIIVMVSAVGDNVLLLPYTRISRNMERKQTYRHT